MAAEPTRAENDAADRALAQWLAKAPKEATLEPALEIVDPHHHLWIDALHGGPRRYLIDEIMADMNSGHNVVGTVFVDCFSMYTEGVTDGSHTVGETTFAQGMFAMSDSGAWGKTRVCQGIISRVDLSLGAQKVEQYLRAHMAAGRNFRGIRSFDFAPWPATEAEKEPLADAVFVEGLEVVNKLGLVLEVYAGHSLDTGFAHIAQLADKFPELTIVLNHCGAMAGPALLSTPALVDQWKAGITAVAAAGNQNIVCKLGGIQMVMNGFGTHPSFCSRVRPSGCVLKAHARARGCVCVFVGGWVDG